MNSGLNAEGGAAAPLGDRYHVIDELGEGRFGPTYLAEDMNRDRDRCVVKPFVPSIEDEALLGRVKTLFEQDASVLYELNHKQIPEYRQLWQAEDANGSRLFLVRDYVEGHTYQQLLQSRQRSRGRFNETEITQLLYDLLPVLSYLHTMGIIHRDISPDNIVLRQTDGLPVLINLGHVEEMAATVRSQLALEGSGSVSTRAGKVGYMPREQLDTGSADATSDLYGLAATLLVPATGQDPQQLYNSAQGTWRGFDLLSPRLGAILEKMLAVHPSQRFQSTDEVFAALQGTQANQTIADQTIANSLNEAGSSAVNGAAFYDTDAPTDAAEPDVIVVYDDDVVVPMTAVGAHAIRPDEVSSTYMTHGDSDIPESA
ncbi:MAG: serine/threonine-protein kinase, partial [Phormidesmis sp.]